MAAMPCRALLAVALLVVSVAAAPKEEGSGSVPAWYRCSCARAATAGCVCPSTAPPLSPAFAVPQFVLFTHDDAVKPDTFAALREALGGAAPAHGCRPATTLFALARATNCTLLRQLYDEGHEVASHSLTHQKMNGWSRAQVEAEVEGGRAAIARECGIPLADIRGFRQPFLQSSPVVREVLHAAGFLYDSTLIDDPLGDSLSRGMAARLWPYGMQDGIPQNCDEWEPYQTCERDERYPGLFQVPVWDLASTGLFSDAEGARQGRSVYEILVRLFEAAYRGNRAPLPLYVHTGWLVDNVADVRRFVEYASGKPHVYFVTMRQLLAWLQNPVPAAQLTAAALGCGNPGGAPGSMQPAAAGAGSGAAVVPRRAAEEQPEQPGAAATSLEVTPVEQQPEAPLAPNQQQAAASAAAGAALTTGVAATPRSRPARSISSGGKLGPILAGAIGGAAVALAAMGAVALVAARRRRRAAEPAGGSCGSCGVHGEVSAYAGHLPPGATASVTTSVPGSWKLAPQLRDELGPELEQVVEQSGTPASTRRRHARTPFQ